MVVFWAVASYSLYTGVSGEYILPPSSGLKWKDRKWMVYIGLE
jgi:hypothetical protein